MLLSASCEAVFTSSTVANLYPFNVFFIVGNKKKSQGARSGEWGWWGTTVHPREAKYRVTDKAV